MRTFTVVEVDKLFTLFKELLPVFRHEAIELVVFDGPKEPFDVRIVRCPAFSIHGYPGLPKPFDVVDILLAGKLSPLI